MIIAGREGHAVTLDNTGHSHTMGNPNSNPEMSPPTTVEPIRAVTDFTMKPLKPYR